jgi:hypothetical protein
MIFIILNAIFLNVMADGWHSRFRTLCFVALIFGLIGDYLIISEGICSPSRFTLALSPQDFIFRSNFLLRWNGRVLNRPCILHCRLLDKTFSSRSRYTMAVLGLCSFFWYIVYSLDFMLLFSVGRGHSVSAGVCWAHLPNGFLSDLAQRSNDGVCSTYYRYFFCFYPFKDNFFVHLGCSLRLGRNFDAVESFGTAIVRS